MLPVPTAPWSSAPTAGWRNMMACSWCPVRRSHGPACLRRTSSQTAPTSRGPTDHMKPRSCCVDSGKWIGPDGGAVLTSSPGCVALFRNKSYGFESEMLILFWVAGVQLSAGHITWGVPLCLAMTFRWRTDQCAILDNLSSLFSVDCETIWRWSRGPWMVIVRWMKGFKYRRFAAQWPWSKMSVVTSRYLKVITRLRKPCDLWKILTAP